MATLKITQLEKFTSEAAKRTSSMFPKIPKLKGTAAQIRDFLDSVNAPSAIRTVLGSVVRADLAQYKETPVPGAVVFVESKNGNRRHGFALHRAVMVSGVNSDGSIAAIRFHSGRILRNHGLQKGEFRAATRTEIKKFLTENWANTPKRENVEKVLA